MTIEAFKIKLKDNPKQITFSQTMKVIEDNFNFTPTAFKNGTLSNTEEQNYGSCKIFAFAIIEGLSKAATLACFGQYYFDEVLNHPNGSGHHNIRNFIHTGFEGLSFNNQPLTRK